MISLGRVLFAYALTIIAVGAAAWALYDPRPYRLVVGLLALLPWLALVATARGRKPDLYVPLMLPGCVLGLRAVIDVQLLERWQPLLPAAAIAFVMAMLIRLTREDREFPLWLYLLLFVPVMSFYSYGSVVLANKQLDRSSPKLYLTFVYDRSMHKVSRQMVWDLRLGPWGPRKEAESVSVPRGLYEATQIDDGVCVLLHPGAFGIRWFEVAKCG
ncbi:MAG TPA: hypothetical protein VH184_23140 [Dongiaceae bacterium]|nr:hypothetical protein [Dongiaceae bacterium]